MLIYIKERGLMEKRINYSGESLVDKLTQFLFININKSYGN